MNRKKRDSRPVSYLTDILCTAAVVLFLIWTAFPFVYALFASVGGWKTLILWSPEFLGAYFNTFLCAVLITAANILVSVPCAYFFRANRSRMKNMLYALYIVLLLLPYQASMLPEYILADAAGLTDSLLSVIIPSAFAPLSVIILAQTFRSIPEDALEAFRLESSSLVREIVYIGLPCAKSGLICCGVLIFTGAWNMLERPMCLLSGQRLMLLQQYIGSAEGAVSFAAVIVSALAPFLLFLFSEEKLRSLVIAE